ncbi:MAG: dihydrodipicolinate synthase family protein [Planctomycetaceae bacterium]
MKHERLNGLIAATLTPFSAEGDVNLEPIGAMVEFLISNGINGLYVCGSTGEGMSLTSDERKAVTAEFVKAASGRIPVIAQVGHNSIAEAKELAKHAASVGVDIVSATCPSYFKAADNLSLTRSVAQIAAAASDLPFYYYHIPSLTGSTVDIVRFLEDGRESVPNLVGLKYTDTKLFEYQMCLAVDDHAFDVVWGCDEMLLGALATGAKAAIGSTYNVAAPLSQRIIDAFSEGDIEQARTLQLQSALMIRELLQFPFHASLKMVLTKLGLPLGGVRPPLKELLSRDAELLTMLEDIEFHSYGCKA